MRRLLGLAAILAVTGCNDTPLVSAPLPPGSSPVAILSGETDFQPLDTATFDASESYDPDGGSLSFDWEIVDRPSGSTAAVYELGGGMADFFVDLAGDYRVRVTVTDDEGEEDSSTLEFSAVPWNAIHVQLVWNLDFVDVDMHLVNDSTNGQMFDTPYDCYFSNMTPDWGPGGAAGNPRLDIDDVDGYGPENINMDQPENGKLYHVYVHYWSDSGFGETQATLRIYLSGALAHEQIMTLPGTDAVWDALTLEWPSGEIHEINDVTVY